MDDPLHDLPKEAIPKLPLFSGGNPAAARKHLLTVINIINRYCLSSQYNHEDVKICLFGFSLKGDAIDWFRNCPEEYFYYFQNIVKAFIEKYMTEDDSPFTPSIVQNNENDRVENSTVSVRSPDNSREESTCPMIAQIHDSGEAEPNCQTSVDNDKNLVKELIQMVKDIQLNQAQVIKNMEANQAEIIKNMELNQARLTVDHTREIDAIRNKLLALEEKMTIMEFNHSNQMNAMEERHDEEMAIMEFDYNNQLATMQANHEREINYMQDCFMAMKAGNDKVIKDMETGQMSLQHRLLTVEKNHAKEISTIKVKHSNLEKAERSQLSTEHRPPSLLKQAPSYYEETISSIEKWLIEGDPDRRKTEGNQVNKSPLTEQMNSEERHVTHILFTSSESSQEEGSTSSTIQSSTKKSLKRKRKRIRKRFDSSDGREQLDIRIRQSPTLCKIGHGTSEKQPTDLPESRQMLSMHYIEHI